MNLPIAMDYMRLLTINKFLAFALRATLHICIFVLMFSLANAQDEKKNTAVDENPFVEQKTQMADQIKVQPTEEDQTIAKRLTNILQATGWFSEITVQVEEGVVFLDGRSNSKSNRAWAGELAGRVIDVVAVVNRIQVTGRSPWDFSPAVGELSNIWRGVLQGVPRFGLGVIVLVLVWLVAKLTTLGLRKVLGQRFNPILRDVAVRLFSILVFLFGFYLALQIAGLSGLSATVLGGTGIAGLIAGIAFRDLLENYLASILISIRNPFRLGDLVEISSHLGIVERVTTRGTVLMNQDGNHVQIPNAIVYKSIIRNYTANPNRREMFEVGIGYENQASHAQKVALEVMSNHPAVLSEPELLVLVDRLGSATVNLKVYFWYDGSKYNGLKVRSSLIRMVKQSFEQENISMPDEAREILFPEGVPVRMLKSPSDQEGREITHTVSPPPLHEEITIAAEGDLCSEELQLRDQARASRVPEEGESLLKE